MSLNKSKSLRTAEKYALQGKIPAAIDEYRKVVDADPTDLTTINTLGDLYVRAGKIQDAIANFSRIAESYRESGFTLKAIAMLKKISKLDPTNVETAMKLANLYSQQGLLVEARQQYLQVADAYARAGQTRKALEAYQRIADLDPANTSVRMKLGEIYSRENMPDQAHEAFIMAGAEFLRKGDVEQALNANLKAIGINSESRQGLTAIATIYTQQGQADRAISVLCDAFERSPGDVELLTILGRTYLSAGLMDDAERTFLSLVELDRNRYHYLLEVGRRFLQLNNLDRAAEQIDGCLDVLIGKREEDKAIEFLRRVLERDMNHIGSLKRLAQIFLRIREDHNLIATLNSLAEASMRNGDDEEAIAALKELARLEPDEPIHLQRLYNLGVKDITEADSPDVIRATGPLDYESAAFDDTFVIRQISEAEILAGHGQVDHAVAMLKEILVHAPENLQVHLKLKDIYLRAGMMDQAATECLQLARIHETRGESARSSDYLAEARQLNPNVEELAVAAPEAGGWSDKEAGAFGFESGFDITMSPAHGNGSYEAHDDAGALDLSKYQTGQLSDQTGFVTVPGQSVEAESHQASPSNGNGAPVGAHSFRYSDMLIGEATEAGADGSQPGGMMFGSSGDVATDTMTPILRDELEGIDFYIAQGYSEIARDTLDRLKVEHGEHPEILSRYKRLGMHTASDAVVDEEYEEVQFRSNEYVQAEPDADFFQSGYAQEHTNGNGAGDEHVAVLIEDESPEVAAVGDEFTVAVSGHLEAGDHANALPFLVHKESGPLDPDLMVQFNTSDLLNNTVFETGRPPTGVLPEQVVAVEQEDIIGSIVSDIDSSFDNITEEEDTVEAAVEEYIQDSLQEPDSQELGAYADEPDVADKPDMAEAAAESHAGHTEAELVEETVESYEDHELVELDAPVAEIESVEVVDSTLWLKELAGADGNEQQQDTGLELQEIFEELKENTGDLKPLMDFETHYNLGLAYKDMDVLDDAIEQFQMAFRMAGEEETLKANYIQCCHMLGVCFKRKQMLKVAVMWFERGLRIAGRTEDEYQALRYEMGFCLEEMGEVDRAIDVFMEVYGIDVNYRQVARKIQELQELKTA
ncbi:MAG TPA: tetratricopeptide repeat protein [Blastocatellia bacterium]|nr:tetratricopeptide repeat protein [Blastocatellia bacterium]